MKLLLYDDRAVWHRPDAVFDGDPVEQRRRVPNPDERMNSVAGAHLSVVLPILSLIAEVVHERSQTNQKIRIRGGRQRRARASVLRRCRTASIAARAQDRNRETYGAQLCERQELAAADSWHGQKGSPQDAWKEGAGQLVFCRDTISHLHKIVADGTKVSRILDAFV
ncbi:hypothetical protein [Candidatus Binatus sp.]|uniref:hypothetical protein n=1 Tax=Candidatus Binatus sp. TaxID=2811406 RepID=UPI002F3E39B1